MGSLDSGKRNWDSCVVPPSDSISSSSSSSIDMSVKTSLSSSTMTGGSNSLDNCGKISDGTSSDGKCSGGKISDSINGSAKTSGRPLAESAKSSISRPSNSSDLSDESSCSSFTSSINKPHKANDKRWEAIQAVRMRDGNLGLSHFRLLKRLGCGDIGSVYLAELRSTNCQFAMKVMDKGSLASRKKLLRAQTEKEILQSLDHPFLPTLYTHFETEKFSCLVMEFCMGGDLHTLRQKQPGKHFTEQAARFYASEVLLSLEYLHMLGVVYRDLKPENVLVREDGHIMLSDFDLSLQCVVSPTLIRSSAVDGDRRGPAYCIQPACVQPSCIQPACVVQPSCFLPKFLSKSKSKKNSSSNSNSNSNSNSGSSSTNSRKHRNDPGNQVSPLMELVAEPTGARSMSFVGTHEYLAPEIIKGEGHGSAVDWWTFGIFLYELLHGKTPFKGSGNRATLFNVVGQPLKFPENSGVSFAARDLIRGLLVKDPQHRLASKRGATEIKQHPFFEGVNWALIRSTSPPEIPKPMDPEPAGNNKGSLPELTHVPAGGVATPEKKSVPPSNPANGASKDTNPSPGGSSYLDFDFF